MMMGLNGYINSTKKLDVKSVAGYTTILDKTS